MDHTSCGNCKQDFVIQPDDFAFYEHMQVPPPTLCPSCRARRRMAWWNEHNLFRKKDARDGKEIFSTYPEHSPIKIYEHDYWWSDAWDAMEFGRDYDPSRSFFDQMKELMHAVPRSSREIKSLVNSDYSDNSSHLKNCYLCFDSDFCEESAYMIYVRNARNSFDIFDAKQLDLCYELMGVIGAYQCFFTVQSDNCRNVWLSRNCDDCEDCFGCANLKHKKYHIFNQSYEKEEYFAKLKEMNLGSYAGLQKAKDEAYAFWKTQPYRYMTGMQTTQSIGDYLYHCKNVRYGFQVDECEDVAYCQRVVNHTKNTYDLTSWGDNSELIYDSVVCGENNQNVKFSAFCWPANTAIEYCMSCHSSSNLFGCVGLRKKEYCILNKQYTREEYETLVAKIRAHMIKDKEYGEFFPVSMSPLAYNETVAIDYFPLSKDEAIAQGFAWHDPEAKEYKITMSADQLPDHIKDAPTDIAKAIIGCGECKKAFRILDRELDFFKRFALPLPRVCHNCRYRARIAMRNPMQWWKRNCAKCGTNVETTYDPKASEIIYCEPCYQQEVM